MATFIVAPLLAFIVYAVILPLIGVAIGFLLIVAVPYLIGSLVGIFTVGTAGMTLQSLALIALISLAWAGLVLVVRTTSSMRSLRRLCWLEGHYLSAFRVLTFGGLTAIETESGHPWRLNRRTAAHGH